MGVVDKVGWNTFKKVFRSYQDEKFVKDADYSGGKVGKTREFLDRVARFSGQPNLYRSLPDKGKLLDKYFSPQVVTKSPSK